MRRHLKVTLGDNWAEVSGHGSRDLILEIAGRAPMWLSRSRAWSTTPKRARDLAALAEARGYDVTVTAEDSREALT